ncbi:MAG: copper resistance protein CopC, partial [Actinobacteria bacterium]|nr:copper resistance protein CopC [Actinomycetota bacterium]
MPARALAALLAAAAVLAVAAPSAGAHAAFLGSSPAPGERVGTPPAAVTLRFTEEPDRRLSSVRLLDARSGRRLPAQARASGTTLVLAPAANLARGSYRVQWRTVATDDGHELEGTFGFGVQTAALKSSVALQRGPLAGASWLRALVRALMYAALLAFVGALILSVLLDGGRRDSWLVPTELERAAATGAGGAGAIDAPGTRRRARAVVSDLGLFAAALTAAVAVMDAARAAGGLSPARIGDYLLANQAGLARVAVVLLVLLALACAARRPGIAAAAGGASLGAIAVAGHANSAAPRAPALLADWAHLLGGAVWLGGIATIALVWGPTLRRGSPGARLAIARHVLPAFGSAALPAFVVVVVAGVFNAAVELGRPLALLDSDYGIALLAKIALVGAIALTSYRHAVRLRPRLLAANPHPSPALERRHWGLMRVEPLLAAAVVAAAALLVAFPLPPRQLDAAGERASSSPPCEPCPLPTPGAGELSVAGAAGSTLVAAWIQRHPGTLTGTVRLIDFRGRPSSATARVPGARQRGCGVGCISFALPGAQQALRVEVHERGRRYAT